MNWIAIVLFAATYILITLRRLSWIALDRPAVALLGAVACVVVGVITPIEAIHAIHGPTIVLLFGVMGMGACLSVFGFFDRVQNFMIARAGNPSQLLGMVVWGAGVLSAFLTNDAVCVLGAPVIVRMIEQHKLPAAPFLLALATAANTGSVATLVGNPQNMLCGDLGGLSFSGYFAVAGPVALVSLAVNHALLHLIYRRQLKTGRIQKDPSPTGALGTRNTVSLVVIGLTAVAYLLGANLPFAATTGFVVLMVAQRIDTRQLWRRIDWSILLFFAGLFIVVEAFLRSGATDWLFERFPLPVATDHRDIGAWAGLSGIFLVGSNIVSNVPFILVVGPQMSTLPDAQTGWTLLAMASTFAGNLTLLGSVANIIVAQAARDVGGIGFVEHLRVGLPLAFITTGLGTLWIMAVQ